MKLLVILAIFVGLISATCTGTSCSSCTADPGCGWCAATQACMAGTLAGPSEGVCLSSWNFDCPPCASYSGSCRECLGQESCTWDPSGEPNQQCVLLVPDIPRTCPCATFPDCDSCIYESPQSACSWCETSGSCIASGGTCAGGLLAHTCSCTGYFDCASCLSNEGCEWCNENGHTSCVPSGGCEGTPLTCSGYCALFDSSCQNCINEAGCVYCDGENKCYDQNEVIPGCFKVHTCPVLCPETSDCSTCLQSAGCSWCDSKACLPLELASACSEVTLNCMHQTKEKGGFSGGSFVGGMFLMLGIVGLGAAVFAWYRRRQAHGVYESVN